MRVKVTSGAMGTEFNNTDIVKIQSLLEDAYDKRISDLTKSIDLANSALEQSKLIENQALQGKSYNHLALCYMIRAEYEASKTCSNKAVKIFQKLGDEIGLADAKYNLAGIYYKTDNFHSGLMYLLDSLQIYRKHKNYHQIARCLKSLGTIYEFFGDQKKAIDSYLEAIDVSHLAKDKNLESNALNPLSGIYLNNGDISIAMSLIMKSIDMKKETGDIRGRAFALYGRGKIYTAQAKYELAEKDFLDAMGIHVNAGEKLGLGMVYHKLGVLYYKWSKLDKAKEYLHLASDFSEKYSIALLKDKCLFLLYEAYKKEGDTNKALQYLEKYQKEREAVVNSQTLKVMENYDKITKIEFENKEIQLQKEKEEIIAKKELAEEAVRMKQEFLSTMSHEIRTPLNAVITIASMLDQKGNLEEQQLIQTLNFSAKNLLYIINDILDFTKLESGKVSLEFRPVDFRLFINNIFNTYVRMAHEKGLEFTYSIQTEVSGAYMLDEIKLSQILGNLITNAIKFTEQDEICFKVIDTGEGIKKTDQKKIFESFSQPRSIKTRKEGGSGLGLAIVKELVTLHGSEIRVHSIYQKGSEFFFQIKAKKSELPQTVRISQSDQLKGKWVLVAEDNRINAMVVGKVLTGWGINYEVAENGLMAVSKSNHRQYDYILMDIHMPELDGFEAARKIKEENDFNQNTPIFALTADITAEQQEFFNPLFNGFLHKPIEKEKLFDALCNS
ncbi:MAG: tetratricopeptide repeat protein [Balneolales bacterium]|nr:tetratricopeptide repeat protein [Balneolales bacterium]